MGTLRAPALPTLRSPGRSALPRVGEFARMMPRQNFEQQWLECAACGAAMGEDEIEAAQQVPARRK